MKTKRKMKPILGLSAVALALATGGRLGTSAGVVRCLQRRLEEVERERDEALGLRPSRSICEWQAMLARQAVQEWDGVSDKDLLQLLSEKLHRDITANL
jgi:hypothetical protein